MTVTQRVILNIKQLIRHDDGGALAELAIMVPFLVIMLAAVSEIGRFFQSYTTLAKATRSSARYLSNHSINTLEVSRATNLVVCGKLTCSGGDELVKGYGGGASIAPSNVCIEAEGTTVTVRIPRINDCNPPSGVGAPAGNPYNYQPIFNLGGLLGIPSFTLAPTISPRTVMYKMAV